MREDILAVTRDLMKEMVSDPKSEQTSQNQQETARLTWCEEKEDPKSLCYGARKSATFHPVPSFK
jgi:hypothetical protein